MRGGIGNARVDEARERARPARRPRAAPRRSRRCARSRRRPSSRGRRPSRRPLPAACSAGGASPTRPDAAVVVPHEARVVVHDLLQHAPRELARHARQREQRARRALRRERLAALLDQRRQPVGRPQLELERRGAGPAGRWHPACHANTCSHDCRTPPPAARALPVGREVWRVVLAADGGLERRAGGELRHGRRRDLDLLARVPRVDAGARRALRDVELAEAGEGTSPPFFSVSLIVRARRRRLPRRPSWTARCAAPPRR